MKFFIKLIILFLLVVLLSSIIFSVFSIVKIDNASLNQRLQSKYSSFEPGGWGQTLKRFRDIDNYKNVDILFAGSSHAYRGFDTEFFSSLGIKSFNSGTTSQSPFNTYFILKKYIKKLSPKLIILELYPTVLTVDGYESFIDIAKNTNFSLNILQMALSLKSLNAFKALIEICTDRMKVPLETVKQKIIEKEIYISGGYCKSGSIRDRDDPAPEKEKIVPLARQLKYIKRIVNLSFQQNSEVLVVIHPLPEDHFKSIDSYDQLSQDLKVFVNSLDVEFLDFNYRMKLDSYLDFKDDDHLNSSGVEKFNKELVKYLRSSKKYKNLFTMPDFDNKIVAPEKL